MYVKITNGIPETYTIGQLRKDNPNVSFPKSVPDAILADYDVYPLSPSIEPNYNPDTQVVETGDISWIEGAWRRLQTVRDLTEEELNSRKQSKIEAMTNVVQRHLDKTARDKGYDSIISIATYVNSTNATFSAEANTAVKWRDDVWVAAHAILNDVLAGNRAEPTADELIAELPVINWPGA